MKKLLIYLTLILAISCNKSSLKDNSRPLVKVFDKNLYYEDVKNMIPKGLNKEDSVAILETYINNWVQEQLMIHYANIYLKDEKQDIEKKVNDYRNNLLISEFSDVLITKNLDSNFTLEAISQYYDKHTDEFELEQTIIQGFFVRLPVKVDSLSQVRSILIQTEESDLDNILNYCTHHNGFFEDFSQNWQILAEEFMKLPLSIDATNTLVKNQHIFEAKDSNYYYFIKVFNYKLAGDQAPLEFVTPKITKILLKNQGDRIVETFKQEKFNEALKNNQIEFYDTKN